MEAARGPLYSEACVCDGYSSVVCLHGMSRIMVDNGGILAFGK